MKVPTNTQIIVKGAKRLKEPNIFLVERDAEATFLSIWLTVFSKSYCVKN